LGRPGRGWASGAKEQTLKKEFYPFIEKHGSDDFFAVCTRKVPGFRFVEVKIKVQSGNDWCEGECPSAERMDDQPQLKQKKKRKTSSFAGRRDGSGH
jgi:hypothetical protein